MPLYLKPHIQVLISDILKGGGGGIGSHEADGKGGGIENGNPGMAPGAGEALSAGGWVELLAPDFTRRENYKNP